MKRKGEYDCTYPGCVWKPNPKKKGEGLYEQLINHEEKGQHVFWWEKKRKTGELNVDR